MKKLLIFILTCSVIIISIPNSWAKDDNIELFTKMRMDYANRKDFSPDWERHEDRKKITELWDNGKIIEGMKLAQAWLEKHPIDSKMHAWYGFFLLKKGDFQGYLKHMHIYQGLLASIASSGSGLSASTPMKVISVSEEYAVLHELNAELQEQSLIDCETGAPCDLMECKIGEDKILFFFDVSISMDFLSKQFAPKEDKKNKSTGK